MQSKNIEFLNSDGEALAGILDLPAGEPRAFALFAHCFTCSKNLKAATNISRSMTAAGIAVLRFDFTGLGQSDGEFADTTFSSNVEDLLSAARWLEREHRAPEILFGHSLGGTAVLQAARSIPSTVVAASLDCERRCSLCTRLWTRLSMLKMRRSYSWRQNTRRVS